MTTKNKNLRSKNPADYYFNATYVADSLIPGTHIVICPKVFFDKHGYLYDQHISREAGGPLDLPETLEELQEALFLYTGSVADAIDVLTNLGMELNPRLPV